MILLSHFLAFTWRKPQFKRYICPSLFIPALLSIDKALKPKCLLTGNELIKKIWYIVFSHKKRMKYCHLQHGRFRRL